VRREAAEGFFALYAGRVHTARHGVQDGKKARWVVGRSLTLVEGETIWTSYLTPNSG